MKKHILIAGLIVVVLSACGAPATPVSSTTDTAVAPLNETRIPEPAGSLDDVSVAEALAELKTKDGVSVEVSQGWTIVVEADGLTTWSFTPSNHPANPAVAKRVIYEDEDGWHVKMDILCEAEKAACDQFVKEFEQLNEQMQIFLEQQKQP